MEEIRINSILILRKIIQEQINTPAINELIMEMRTDYDTVINPKNVNYGKYG